MKIRLICVGKVKDGNLLELINKYEKRISCYADFEPLILPDLKNTSGLTDEKRKEEEGEMILRKVSNGDFFVLLDERGKNLNSLELADFFQEKMNNSVKRLVFAVGGPFGFSEAVRERADFKLALSGLTFPHELAKLMITEQIYRVFTILKNEKYHK